MTPTAPTEAPALTVRIPCCPNPALSGNSRVHWRVRANVVRDTRIEAGFVAKDARDALPHALVWDGDLRVSAVIAWGRNRKQADPTNLWHLLKAYLDGIADALGCDDKHFIPGTIEQIRSGKDDPFGYVELTLAPA